MTLFKNTTRRKNPAGWIFLALFIIAAGAGVMLPSGYVIERPGTSFNVNGEVDGNPVISVSEVESFESETRLDVLTVSVLGNQDSTPGWIEIFLAWIDPQQVVLPVDEVFPPNKTTDEVRAESVAMMETSQQEAVAVALNELGYDLEPEVYVSMVTEGGAASGSIIAGDFVTAVAGETVKSIEELQQRIQDSNGESLEIDVTRDGESISYSLTPQKSEDRYLIGVMVGYTYDFPIEIDLQLGNVGGPSGGMIFALGVFDALTEGSLLDDSHIAGTGTINTGGLVGPIGGIDLKMQAAKRDGTDLFLAPQSNCPEIISSQPEDLLVVPVADFTEALEAIEMYKDGNNEFPSCEN
jgi:PDZ domain-containing protein